MNKRQNLTLASGRLFFAGLIIARFNSAKLPFVATASFILSTLLYFLGYLAWKMSVDEIQNSKHLMAEKFKQRFEDNYLHLKQYSYAALLGIAACLSLLGALFFPQTLGILSAWLFLGSNTCWLWAENISINNSRDTTLASPEQQAKEHYYTYTLLTTLNSIIFALNITACLFFPALTLPIELICSVLLFSSTVQTFHYWFKSTLAYSELKEEDITPDVIDENERYLQKNSYHRLQKRADFKPLPQEKARKDENTTIKIPNAPFLELSVPQPLSMSL